MTDDIQQLALQTCALLHTLWTAVEPNARSAADQQLQALQEAEVGWDVACLLIASSSNAAPTADVPALRFAGAQILRKKVSDHYDSQLRGNVARKQRVWGFLLSSLQAATHVSDDLGGAVREKLCQATAEFIARELLDPTGSCGQCLVDFERLLTGPSIRTACDVLSFMPDPLQQIVTEVGSPFRGSRWHNGPEASACLEKLLPVVDACLASTIQLLVTQEDGGSLWSSLFASLHAWLVAIGGRLLAKCPATTLALSPLLARSLGPGRQPSVYFEFLEQLFIAVPSLADTFQVLDLATATMGVEALLRQSGQPIDALAFQCLRCIDHFSTQVLANFNERAKTLPSSFLKTLNHYPDLVLLPSLEDERHTCAIASLLGRFCSSQIGFACIGLLDDRCATPQFGDNALTALAALMATTPPVFNIVNLALVDLAEALRLFRETIILPDSRSFDLLMTRVTDKLLKDWWLQAVLQLHRDNFYSHYTHEHLRGSLCELAGDEFPEFEDAMRDRQQIFDTAEDLPGIIVQTQRMRGDLSTLTRMLESIVVCVEGLSKQESCGGRVGSLEVLIKLSEIFLEVLVSVMRSMSLDGTALPWSGSMPQTLMRGVLKCWGTYTSGSVSDGIVSQAAFAFVEAALLQADDALDADDWQLTFGQVCGHLQLDSRAASRCVDVLSSLHPVFFLGNAAGSIAASAAASTLLTLIDSEAQKGNAIVTATLTSALLQGIRTAANPREATNVCRDLITRAMAPLLLVETASPLSTLPNERLTSIVGSLILLFQQTSVAISLGKSESSLSYWYGSVIYAEGEGKRSPWKTLLHLCVEKFSLDASAEYLSSHSGDFRRVISNEELRTQLSYAVDEETGFFNVSYISMVRLAFAVMTDFISLVLGRKIPESEMQKELFNETFMALKDACICGKVSVVQGGPAALLAHMLRVSLPPLRMPATHYLADRPIVELTQTMAPWRRADLVTPMWQLHLMLITSLGRKNYSKFIHGTSGLKAALHQASIFALQSCEGLLVSVALKVLSACLEPQSQEWHEILMTAMDYMVFWPNRVFGDLLNLLDRVVFTKEENLQSFLQQLDAHWNDPKSVVIVGDCSSLPALINADHRRLVLRCIQVLRGLRLRQLLDDLSRLCHHTANHDIFVSYEMLLASVTSTSQISAARNPVFVADID